MYKDDLTISLELSHTFLKLSHIQANPATLQKALSLSRCHYTNPWKRLKKCGIWNLR